MGKIAFFAILVLFGLTNSVFAAQCRVITGNGINNWYPFSYRTDNGELSGLIVDGFREALIRQNIQLTIDTDKPWKRILFDLEVHNIDTVLGIYWNSDRASKYLFTNALSTDEIRAFVKQGNEFTFETLDDLKDRAGLRLLGGSLGDEFDAYASANLSFYEVAQSADMIKMLRDDRADYGILGHFEGLKFAADLGLIGQIVPLSKAILANAMHVMMHKNAACADALPSINRTIEAMQKDGSLGAISNRHYGNF